MIKNNFSFAADLIKNSSTTSLFSGAGISVESGIPPFRGENGIWNKFDPKFLDIDFFRNHPSESWSAIKEIFYKYSLKVTPNQAHYFFARLENNNMLNAVITQNIDDLHQKAGSFNVIELHGTTKRTICINCGIRFDFNEDIFNDLPPKCENCGGLLKPDFIFFGEPLPPDMISRAFDISKSSKLQILIGTSGEVYPASRIPFIAKDAGAKILEINTKRSNYTDSITDVFLEGKASDICRELENLIFN